MTKIPERPQRPDQQEIEALIAAAPPSAYEIKVGNEVGLTRGYPHAMVAVPEQGLPAVGFRRYD